jgi:stage IV sporulation protein B
MELLMKKTIKMLTCLIALMALTTISTTILYSQIMPDSFSVVEGRLLEFNNTLPISTKNIKDEKVIQAVATLKAGNNYSTEIELFGCIPIKKVTVNIVKETEVIPSGAPFGLKLYTEGVMIVGMSDVDTSNGPKNPAYDAGVRIGDIIMAINGKPMTSNSEVAKAFESCNGNYVKISLKRKTIGFEVSFKPSKSITENVYKVGLWVRDSTAGIGTLTFYSPSAGMFAGLGHGICDVDTGELLPLLKGEIVKANINGIVKGNDGQPGELKGYFINDTTWGNLDCNSETGVFGVLNGALDGKAMPVAMKQQVHEGPAKILVTIDGDSPQEYNVSIERVHFNDAGNTKNMVIKITDSKLISKTGGIVQGMSGTPIIQDGLLIGAITHVFVNDPTHGYGIFAENMIKTMKNVVNPYKKAGNYSEPSLKLRCN